MLKIGCLWMMLSISVTAFAQDTSSDCDKEYYDRYGRWMENHLVTWWGVPPCVGFERMHILPMLLFLQMQLLLHLIGFVDEDG